MATRIRTAALTVVLVGALLASIVFTISFGSAGVPAGEVFGILWDQVAHGGSEIAAGQWSVPHYMIIWNIRLPRVLFGVLCGAGLALCGAVMQALVLNPIADPYVLGVSSGASAGAAWALLMPLPLFAGSSQTMLMALAGALLSSFLVYSMARIAGGGRLRPVSLLLSGTAINAVMTAIMNFLIFLAKSPESIAAVYNWQMGSLASAQWSTLLFPLVAVGLGLVIFWGCSGRLDILMMGDDDALAMGLPVKAFRNAMFFVCAVLVASLVSFTGLIGFVGLVVPHVVRILTGSNSNRVVIPLSALLGGVYLIWADAIARSAFGSAELPIGIITAFVGAPFFLYLMAKSRYGGGDR